MQHQKSKSEFAKFKTKKIFKKVFCLLHNYKQSPLPKKKKNVQQIAPSTFEKKAKHTSLKKERFQKKTFIFPSLFFCLFFLSNHHTTKQKYFLVSCRNKNL